MSPSCGATDPLFLNSGEVCPGCKALACVLRRLHAADSSDSDATPADLLTASMAAEWFLFVPCTCTFTRIGGARAQDLTCRCLACDKTDALPNKLSRLGDPFDFNGNSKPVLIHVLAHVYISIGGTPVWDLSGGSHGM